MAFYIISERVEDARFMPTGRGLALGAFAEQFYGPVQMPESMQDEDKVFFRGFFNWFRLVHFVGSGHGYLLDKTQRQAYHMLLDWWSGTYCDPEACIHFLLSKLAPIIFQIVVFNEHMRFRRTLKDDNGETIHVEVVKADLCVELWEEEKFSHPAVEKLEACVSYLLEFLGHRYDTITGTVMDLRSKQFAEGSIPIDEISAYDWAMWHIFRSQFCGIEDEEPQRQEHIAVGDEYYQDTEFLVLRNRERGRITRIEEREAQSDSGEKRLYILRPPKSDRLVPKTTADFMEICLSEATNFEWPEIQVRNLLVNNIIPHGVDNGLEIYRDYPQYLWNHSTATLVKTSALVRGGPPPAFTAITHLGRRREAGEGHSIPNGWKYPVPSNDKFEVGELVRDLQELRGTIDTEYVWMDLLCLPQCEEDDEEDDNGQDFQLKLLEISQQAAIFRTAERVMKWPQKPLDVPFYVGTTIMFQA